MLAVVVLMVLAACIAVAVSGGAQPVLAEALGDALSSTSSATVAVEPREGNDHDTSHSGWTAITGTQTLSGGNYYLNGDVTGDLTITGTVTLCLNGYVLTGSGNGSVITISSGGNLTLCDCRPNTTHSGISYTGGVITGGKTTGSDRAGGGVEVYPTSGNASFTMYGGTIAGKSSEESGGGVTTWANTTFTMYGGTITNNTGDTGGGVRNGGTFYMYGGTISGNTTAWKGAELYVNNVANIQGGTIGSGTVYIAGSKTLNISDGYIGSSFDDTSDTANITGGYFANGDATANTVAGRAVASGCTAVDISQGNHYGDTDYQNGYPYAVYTTGSTSGYGVASVTVTYGTSYTPIVSGNTHNVEVSYSYKDSNEEAVNDTPSAVGTYTGTATFAAYIDGANKIYYPETDVSFIVTINSATPSITATVSYGSTQTNIFTYGDTITISGTVTAAPSTNGVSLLAEPEQNQVGLYVSRNDSPIAKADVTTTDGSFILQYNTASQLMPTGSQTLTVKYGGSSGLTSGEATATITLNQKAVTASLSGTTAKTYDGETNAPTGLTVGLSGVLSADTVTVSAESITYDDANAGANKTITATGITLSGDDAKWYSLSSDTAATTGSITAAASSVDTAPEANTSLTFTVTAQALVTAGSASNGTMVYALGTSADDVPADNYSATIPTGTNAGTYYVWYKVQADQNYSDTAPVCVTVTIAKATPELALAASPASLRGRGTVTLTLTGVPEGGGSVTVACDDGSITVAAGDDGAWTASLPNRTQTYTFTASFDGNDNYDPTKASCTVEVTYRSTYVPPAHTDGPSTSGSEGWDDIKDEIAGAEGGGSIVIDMGGETEVPGEVFEEVAGKDVDVTFELEDGVSWTVNGQDVPKGADIGDLDLGVGMGTDGIPVDVINAVTGEVGTVQIALAHDGEFGFEMVLTAPLGRENAGYWANLYHYDEDDERLSFETDARIDDDGSVSLRLSHASQYAIVIDKVGHALPFADASEGEWYSEPVRWTWLHGVMTGYDDGSNLFGTEDALTRAQLAATLYKAAGSPAADPAGVERYSDCAYGAWYAEAVSWATDQGLMTGYDDGSGRFAPDAPLTREQLAVVFWRAAGSPAAEADLGAFLDGGETSSWARPAVIWAVSTGLLKGYGNTGELDPAGTLTRAQAATVLYRLATEGADETLGSR
ncbi:S-layer homology domain-containing protein [Collinsella sp. An2]|uniref:S-layer homology domain-containing protein n=1 Tax=Collinsella sp. An2 TaxID=1965585 RepID=UPI000B3824CF|nr:S-layer homology domain-containing protein [Collinsella sp. An2]OUP11022.1 hypothetical protein B5F33_01155 [Collinsella sp. An2]